jgi:hypothetical protein
MLLPRYHYSGERGDPNGHEYFHYFGGNRFGRNWVLLFWAKLKNETFSRFFLASKHR